MTDHSVPENVYDIADRDGVAHDLQDADLVFGTVKLEENHVTAQILNPRNACDDQNFNEKEEKLYSEQASSDSLNVGGEVDYHEGKVRNGSGTTAYPHFAREVKGCTVSDSNISDLALQPEIGCYELNHQGNQNCRASLAGSSKNLDSKTKCLTGVTVELTSKADRGVKRNSSTLLAGTGMLRKGRAESCLAQDLSESRVHGGTIDDQTARAFHSILNREYTEESTGARTIRQSGGKDRHSKVFTSKGPRDRRVRLSVSTAIQFYDVQDRLGYDQPSKAVDWLIKKAKSAIDELGSLPTIGLQGFVASERNPFPSISRIQEPISGLSDCSCCTGKIAYNSNEGSIINSSKLVKSNTAVDLLVDSDRKDTDSPTRPTIKQQAGDGKLPREAPPIRSASGSNLVLNEMPQDMDCVSPLTNTKHDFDTHHAFPGLDDRLKTLELPRTFRMETSNSSQLSRKHAEDSVTIPNQGNLAHSDQNRVVLGNFSSTNHLGQVDARKAGIEVQKPSTFSSSESSNSFRLQAKFSSTADEVFPSRCVDMSQIWSQDQPKMNLLFSTTLSSRKLPAKVSHQFQQLSSVSSFPMSQSNVRLQDQDVYSDTSQYTSLQNNAFSAAATAGTGQDSAAEFSPSVLHSLITRSPEKMYEFGHQISTNRLVCEANNLLSIHSGPYIGASVTPRVAHTQNLDIYPLLQNVPELEDELLSSSGIALGAHHLFRSVSRRPPLTAARGLIPRTTEVPYVTDPCSVPYCHDLASAKSNIPGRVPGVEESQSGGQQTL